MALGCWRTPLLLLTALVLAAKLDHFEGWKGFQEKSMSKQNMDSTLNFFMESYNNASNDSYLFKVDKLLRSQVQLTTGVEYLVTVKISRTKCKRNEKKNQTCHFQSKKLKKSFICDFLIYTVPWINFYELWNNSCLEG
ncbi:PREDICTED: cystatin-like 1 [Condylura cristata]|uniref:cystatin-like 1 n=1 Tax=Condylura cristata TaxID=143302 RepID=UPI0003345E96|nr:PREDICTED: cystatin-like 1 [Condylura cristata]